MPEIEVGDGERPVDALLSKATGRPRPVFFRSLEEARAAEDPVLILEGDWGGTIYATIPLSFLREGMTAEKIDQVSVALEKAFWGCNFHPDDEDQRGGARAYYQQAKPNTGVLGGMGGGVVLDKPWCHPDLSEPRPFNGGKKIVPEIENLLASLVKEGTEWA